MKMKKLTFAIAGVFIASLIAGTAIAGNGNNGLSGPHWQFNIIGHPKNSDAISGDSSNGRAIMVPLKNANKSTDLYCPTDTDINFLDDEAPTYTDQEPAGARIYFEASDRFEIQDRDATDNDGAKILIPTDAGPNPLYNAAECALCSDLNGAEQNRCEDIYCEVNQVVIAVDVYVRVLGKPSTCMNINGYAYDDYQGLYFWSGRIELARKAGKATWMNVNDIFTVWWCDAGDCTNTSAEISVFNNVFESYFWDILNDGTRLVQVRLYPVTE
jgi:hypothetical protein